ncbi:hypothetical protein QFC22_000605 [Naganishia vaughanmartiniae]|uniref:Uncharacterized protein n=1 Tax=Naganishia vaughanmartiniae TaxID=1424756 RepID=A0ACC2XPX9_9TREE|nr:hypothetical protein QFC22_000605 [Naganishia vaughanmartiniae]
MAKSKGSRGGSRGTGSFFTNLPSELKSQLRSQTFSESANSEGGASPQSVQQVVDVSIYASPLVKIIEATMPANKRRKLSPSVHSMALIPTQPGTGEDETNTTTIGLAEGSGKESWDCTGLVPRYTNHAEMPKNIQKYFYQRNELFSLYASHNILMDETGWFSVTPESIACHIAERCQSDTILDPFCGVGGNVIQFAMTCERVIAIDNDMTRLKLARHNARQYGVADRIEFICGDYIQFAEAYAKRLDQDAKAGRSRHGDEIDVVFLSPPWGGTDYLSLGKNTATPAQTPQTSSRKGKEKQSNDSGLDYLGTSVDANSSSTPKKIPRANLVETFGVPNEMPPYPLSALAPVSGKELFELTSRISPNIAFYLPKNTDTNELAALAPDIRDESGKVVGKEWVEIEEEYVGQRKGWNSLKAITAYYGGIVASEE